MIRTSFQEIKKSAKEEKNIYKRIQISNTCDMEMLSLSYIFL